MKNIRFGALRLGAIALLLATPAFGATSTFTGSLTGGAENPATGSPGTGTTIVFYDSTLHTLRVSVSFSGLVGTTTASHIHCCAVAPLNAGVATQTPYFVGFPIGVTSGSYDHTLDLTQVSSFNPAYVTANGGTAASAEIALAAGMANGQSYLNIHTTTNPAGEIRAFLVLQSTEVPSLSHLGLGLLGLLMAAAGALALRRT